MKIIAQKLEDILGNLSSLDVDWKDDIAVRVIEKLQALSIRPQYTAEDVRGLLDADFNDGILICRLFLGVSKDQFTSILKDARGNDDAGVKAYRADRDAFLRDLLSTGLLEKMSHEVNRRSHWSDVLVERLRSGRGSAISGQRRGRDVENFAEAIVRKVFDNEFQARCTFTGQHGQTAKCDFAIPSKSEPRILIEAKGYGATGSKMTDILGDVGKIISAKRSDTSFLMLTDGLTWRQRQSDLRKLVEHQNSGDITRIYTYAMAEQFERDLRQLKSEYGL